VLSTTGASAETWRERRTALLLCNGALAGWSEKVEYSVQIPNAAAAPVMAMTAGRYRDTCEACDMTVVLLDQQTHCVFE
jgi:hypothetical protein